MVDDIMFHERVQEQEPNTFLHNQESLDKRQISHAYFTISIQPAVC